MAAVTTVNYCTVVLVTMTLYSICLFTMLYDVQAH
eukprot:SAG11_NODE_21145_length_431_cov_0.906627_2_plen_34_part_01